MNSGFRLAGPALAFLIPVAAIAIFINLWRLFKEVTIPMKLKYWMIGAGLLVVVATSAYVFAASPLIKATHTKAHCVAQGKSMYYSCLAMHRPQTTCARLYNEFVVKYCK